MRTIALAVACGSIPCANALTFHLDAIISEASPNPVISAYINDAGLGKVHIALDATGLSAFPGGKISDWSFNFDPALDATKFTQPTFLPALSTGTADPKAVGNLVSFREDLTNLNPSKGFDFLFSWKTSNAAKFAANEILVYELSYTGVEHFDANSFNFANAAGFYTAAHIQGLPGSIKRGDIDGNDEPPPPVPVPDRAATAALLGMSLLGLAAARRSRQRSRQD